MYSVREFVAQVKNLARSHLYISIILGAVIASLSGSAIVFGMRDNHQAAQTRVIAATDNATANNKTKEQSSDNTSNASVAAPAAAKADAKQQPKAQPPAPAAKTRRLIVNPSSITIQAGESQALTVQTDDGAAISMPMFRTPTPQLFLNYPAAPFRTTWSGNIGSMRQSPAGTYTLEMGGQLDRNTYYTGTITVTILPSPYMTVIGSFDGYDVATDRLRFTAQLIRHNGFNQPVRIFYTGYSNAPGPNAIECLNQLIATDTYAVECYHAYGTRPTSGSLNITISTTNDAAGIMVPFDLPPR